MVLANRGVGGDLPVRLGGAAVSHRGADGFDVYLDGIPFLLSINDQIAFSDKTAEWKKQQFDASPEPGEQSLSDWWVRSQASFHSGVGQKYLDSQANFDDISKTRLDTSFNVELAVPGQVSVLPAAETVLPQTGVSGFGFVFPFTETAGRVVMAVDGNNVKFWRSSGSTSAPVPGGLPILAAATDGQDLFVATTGGVYRAGRDGTLTQLYVIPGTVSSVVLGWAKARLMLAVDRVVYELPPAPASTALPTPLYTHPTGTWQWTGFTEGLTSILAAGHAGPVSQVLEFALEVQDGAPHLGAAQVAAVLPHGEICYTVENHSGTFIGFGTSKGVRIGQYDNYYGHLSYGPLSVETAKPVRALTADGRFLFAGVESLDGYSSCLAKIDLGTPLDQQGGRYAWSPHQPPPRLAQGPIRHVTTDESGLLLFQVDGVGVVRQNPAAPTTLPAFLSTSRIRLGTLESKAFRYVQVRGELEPGESVTVTATTPAGSRQPLAVSDANLGDRFAVGITAEWCALRFDLSPGAVLTGYSLYALPAQRRYRQLQIPVWVANAEKSRTGRTFSSPRWAQERYTALREIESRGDEVELRLPALGYDVVRGVIEDITFVQGHPPTDRGANGMAGMAQITFRTTT